MSKTQPTYISNPFKLANEAAKRLYSTNRVWAIVLIVLGILNTLSSADAARPSANQEPAATAANPEISFASIVLIISLITLFMLIVIIIATYMTGILSHITLQSERGKKASLSEAIQATQDRFWRLFGSLVLAAAKIFGWTLLFVIPGIVAALRYSLLGYVIMDQTAEKHGIKDSHERVKKITSGRLLEVLGVSFTGIVPFIGTLYSTAGNAGLYVQLKTYTDKKLEKPAIHWLNYLITVLGVLALCGIILFAVVLASWR